LASSLLHRGNQTLFRDMFGLETVVELCLVSDHLEVVHAAAMAISTVVPTAEARFEAQSEGVSLQVDVPLYM